MKKLRWALAGAALMLTTAQATAATFWYGGVLYGNVCRYGAVYTVYPLSQAQPVGSVCAVLSPHGGWLAYGRVSAE